MAYHPEDLRAGLASARRAAERLLPRHADVDDAVQQAAIRLLLVEGGGLVVRSVAGFLVDAAQKAALQALREQCSRRQREVLDGDLVAGAVDGRGADLDVEGLIGHLRQVLDAPLAGWLDDCLSGLGDDDLAKRDGVDVAAIRMRKTRLKAAILAAPVVKEILEFPVTLSGLLHHRGGGGDPNLRTSEPPNP